MGPPFLHRCVFFYVEEEMALTKQEISQIREELDSCKNPVYFFDDDADGLSSFLLLYRYKREGHGVVVKANSLNASFARKVEEYLPDKVFILDVPVVDPNFLSQVKVPVIYIDHHGTEKKQGVKYFNPRLNGSGNCCTTEMCYEIVEADEWIAMVGAVGDWRLPDYTELFNKKYPGLLGEAATPDEAYFNSKLGLLVKIFSFILKGQTKEVYKCIKILTRVSNPQELLDNKTAAASFIWKKFSSINKEYEELLTEAKKDKPKDEFLVYIYPSGKMSFTKDLSNELLYNFPDKVIIVGREKAGEIKFSVRSAKHILPPLIIEALQGVDGYGGGHEHAVGVCVKKKDLDVFMEKFKALIRKN
jgi:single-stranded DNA-specific DHH superfamily exonuclease